MSEDEICFFADMASACRTSKCYLCGDVRSLEFFSKALPYPSNRIYDSLLNRYSESGSIIERASVVFVITMNRDMCFNFLPDVLKCEGKSYIIDLEYAMQWNLNLECCLLAENLEDCEFFKLIAQNYNHLQGFDIRFHCENGGGTTTFEVLKKCIVQEKMPTLCIIDSDQKYGMTKRYPQEPPKGDTLKKVANIKSSFNSLIDPPCGFFPLEVHEVENLIPLCILKELEDSYPAITDGVNMLVRLQTIDDGNPILYYDMKNGLPVIKEEPKRTYWKEIICELNGTDLNMPPKEKQENASSPFFPALSCKAGLLRKANLLLRQHLRDDLIIDNYLKKHWKNIAEIVFTWGCVSIPMYS